MSDSVSSSKRRSSRRSISSRTSTASKRRSSRRSKSSRKPEEVVVENLKKAKTFLTPYVVTVWTWMAVMNAVFLSWIAQKVAKLYNENTDPDSTKGVVHARKMGNIFHRIFGFLVIDLHPFWNRQIDFDVAPDDLPENAIYVVNHVSFSDGWMLMGALPYSKNAPKGVAQAPVFDTPLVGEVLKENGEIPVYFEKQNGRWRTKKGTREQVQSKALEYLQNDVPVAVMPEGSITKTGHMLPFKPGFFQLSKEHGVPIVPVAIWGNQAAWPMDLSNKDVSTPKNLMGPADVRIRVGSPILPESFQDADELMGHTQSVVREMVHSLPNYHGEEEFYESS